MGGALLEYLLLAPYAAILVLGLLSAWLLLTERLTRAGALAVVVVFGALLEVMCVLFLLRWWHLVPRPSTAVRTVVPFVLADVMILLALSGRRRLLAGAATTSLRVAFWCAVGSLLGYLQLFMGSGY